jgi:hypothetical protein
MKSAADIIKGSALERRIQQGGKTMSKGQKPDFDAKVKDRGRWITIGAGWRTAEKEILSVRLNRPANSFILVRRPAPDAPKTAG